MIRSIMTYWYLQGLIGSAGMSVYMEKIRLIIYKLLQHKLCVYKLMTTYCSKNRGENRSFCFVLINIKVELQE